MGRVVGLRVGYIVGARVGLGIGGRVTSGLLVGMHVGFAVVGFGEGANVGANVGLTMGRRVALRVGDLEGASDGLSLLVGFGVGSKRPYVGLADEGAIVGGGGRVGPRVGSIVGKYDSTALVGVWDGGPIGETVGGLDPLNKQVSGGLLAMMVIDRNVTAAFLSRQISEMRGCTISDIYIFLISARGGKGFRLVRY